MDGLWPGGTSIGDYDTEVLLAEALHWTPEQIDEQDPDFIEQLVAKLSANSKHKPKGSKASTTTSTTTTTRAAAGANGAKGGQYITEPDPDFD
jgi:hypothetical protein